MNMKRRKKLESVAERIAELSEELEMIQAEEQEYYDNVPENLQSSQRYEDSEEAIGMMETAIDYLNDAVDELEDLY